MILLWIIGAFIALLLGGPVAALIVLLFGVAVTFALGG